MKHIGAFVVLDIAFTSTNAAGMLDYTLTGMECSKMYVTGELKLSSGYEACFADANHDNKGTIKVTLSGDQQIALNSYNKQVYFNVMPFSVGNGESLTFKLFFKKDDGTTYTQEITKSATEKMTFARALFHTIGVSCDMDNLKENYTVENDADEDDATVNTLGAAITAAGITGDKIKVTGTMNEADFSSIQSFKYVDLSEVSVVGTVTQQSSGYVNSTIEAATINSSATMTLPAFAFSTQLDKFLSMKDSDRQNKSGGFYYRGNSSYYVENSTLEEIILPNNLVEIGAGAFAYCTALNKVTFSNYTSSGKFKTVGIAAFSGTKFEGASISATASNAPSELVLPISTTTLSKAVWHYTTSLKRVNFSEASSTASLTSAYLFDNCTALSSFILPDDYSGSFAALTLQSCTALKSLYLPETIGSLGGNNVFKSCTGLTTINIPAYTSFTSLTVNSVTTKDLAKLFTNCSNLTSVYVNWTDTTGIPTAYGDSDKTSTFVFPEKFLSGGSAYIYVPKDQLDNYKDVGGWSAFNLAEIDSDYSVVVNTAAGELSNNIPSYWKEKGDNTPQSVKILGPIGTEDYAALKLLCSYISTVDMSSATIDLAAKGNIIPAYALSSSTDTSDVAQLTSLYLPNGVTEIGASAFYMCNLYDISGLDYLETLGGTCFNGGSNEFTSFDIPATMKSIGSNVFGDKVTTITVPWTTTPTCTVDSNAFPSGFRKSGGSNPGTYTLTPPASILTTAEEIYTSSNWGTFGIGEPAAAADDNIILTEVEKGTLATRLGDATPNTTSKVVIAGELNYTDLTSLQGYAYIDLSQVTQIYDDSGTAKTEFPNTFCCNATNASATSTLTAAEAAALSLNLVDIRLPQNIISIAKWAFGGAVNLETVVWSKDPDKTNKTGTQSFNGCVKFDNDDVNALLKDVKKLSDNSFNGCTGITEVYIDADIISMSNNNFQNCSNLTKIHFEGSSAPSLAMASKAFPSTATLILPANAKGKYVISASKNEDDGSNPTGKYWENYFTSVEFTGANNPYIK